jgi:hypothetical protein
MSVRSCAPTAAQLAARRFTTYLGVTGAVAEVPHAQLPTVADLVAALGNVRPGHGWIWRVINTGPSAFEIGANSGWQLAGSMTVAGGGHYRDFVVTIVSDTTATLESIGAGPN